ncbi:putative ABC transport system permease protein [Edaphobacter aggregans]|uniref:Putative ABC transport system permease protein n=1 Tax=Edaphobacter aggregans TaxID=570835 RepID=A0A3R9P7G0_9BACT|nr:FtsX-like permease family protein [Edaphobacter aggregans]RSL15211.1 putative ABC transport system permease protein [Edaphobacter aggregans]
MFFRLLMESFRRQRRRKALAGLAILLGTTAVTAMLALALTIGDRIHNELAVYGANIIVFPTAEQLDVKIGGVDVKPASGSFLKETDLSKLKTIFWANNITGLSPELPLTINTSTAGGSPIAISALGLWFNHPFTDTLKTGAPSLHPWWKINGAWPTSNDQAVIGSALATKLNLHTGDTLALPELASHLTITGVVSTGDATENQLLLPLSAAQTFANLPNSISRVEVSARTKPEDAFARKDPDTLSPKLREVWYCRPYANSIAYQIREAIPGSQAEQVRRVEQSEGTVLARISGLMWLICAAALLAAGFAVSAAMATAILERQGEIGLMRSLGASKGAIAMLFYAETGLLAIIGGTLGYLLGSGLAAWLGARIFANEAAVTLGTILNPVLLPVVIALALVVAIAGSTPSIRTTLKMNPSEILRADA